MNSTYEIFLEILFAKTILVQVSLSTTFYSAIIFSMILRKGVDTYTNLLIFSKLFFEILQVLGSIEMIRIIWNLKFNSIVIKIINEISKFCFYFGKFCILLLIYHRFRLVRWPMNENEIICFKKIIPITLTFISFFIYNIIAFFYLGPILSKIRVVLFLFIPCVISLLFLRKTLLMIRSKRKYLKRSGNVSTINRIQSKHFNKEIKIIIYLSAIFLNLLFYLILEIFNTRDFLFLNKDAPSIKLKNIDQNLIYIFFSLLMTFDSIVLLVFNDKIRKNLISIFLINLKFRFLNLI